MVRSSSKHFIHLKSLLLSTLLATVAAAVLVIVAHAQDPYPTIVCSPGYYWREAFTGDQVCVTAPRYWQVRDENLYAKDYIDEQNPSGAIFGGDGCIAGYVWRQADPYGNDHVCVTQPSYIQAQEENRHADEHLDFRYNYPVWGDRRNGAYRLDLCLSWGNDCGWPAAENFCHHRMWTGARNYLEDPNIGASQPTQGMFFDSNQVCRESFCNGFKYITCYGKIDRERVRANPSWNGYHLDWCYGWAKDCGKKAADAFCSRDSRMQVIGMSRSFYYEVDTELSTETTYKIGWELKCDPHIDSVCRSFKKIICQ
jgi:hypothetical protein